MATPMRSWLPKAAVLWVDMERGLYPWPKGKQPTNANGSYRVVKSQILKDCEIGRIGNPESLPWDKPEFQRLVQEERNRRDIGVANAVAEIETVHGPIGEIGDRIISVIRQRLEEDPEELSTKELLQYGPQWVRLGLEVEGKIESAKQHGIETVLTQLVNERKVTTTMVDQALELVKQYRSMQDAQLATVIDGELDE